LGCLPNRNEKNEGNRRPHYRNRISKIITRFLGKKSSSAPFNSYARVAYLPDGCLPFSSHHVNYPGKINNSIPRSDIRTTRRSGTSHLYIGMVLSPQERNWRKLRGRSRAQLEPNWKSTIKNFENRLMNKVWGARTDRGQRCETERTISPGPKKGKME
jgi:hypothetical protein